MHIFVNFSQIFNPSHHWKGHGSALKNISVKPLKELIQLQNVNRIISNLTKISCSVYNSINMRIIETYVNLSKSS